MNRIIYIDNLKGLAILLVVAGHVTEWSLGINDTSWNHLYSSFHMPLFMMLSGIFAYKGFFAWTVEEIIAFLHKKFLRILVPFITFGGGISLALKEHWWVAYTGKEFGGYWFLPALFYCMISGLAAEWLLNKYNVKKHLWPDVIAHIAVFAIAYVIYISGIVAEVPYYLHFAKMYPFFAMGVIFSRHEAFGKVVRENNTLFTICLLLYIMLWWCQSRGGLNLSGFPAIVILIQLFIRYDSRLPKIFLFLGRYSLEIYLFHYFFLPPLTGMGTWLSQQAGTTVSSVPFTVEMLTSILIALPIIALCILVATIVRNSKFLSMVVLGEKNF